jgi:hypothetical protein
MPSASPGDYKVMDLTGETRRAQSAIGVICKADAYSAYDVRGRGLFFERHNRRKQKHDKSFGHAAKPISGELNVLTAEPAIRMSAISGT